MAASRDSYFTHYVTMLTLTSSLQHTEEHRFDRNEVTKHLRCKTSRHSSEEPKEPNKIHPWSNNLDPSTWTDSCVPRDAVHLERVTKRKVCLSTRQKRTIQSVTLKSIESYWSRDTVLRTTVKDDELRSIGAGDCLQTSGANTKTQSAQNQ